MGLEHSAAALCTAYSLCTSRDGVDGSESGGNNAFRSSGAIYHIGVEYMCHIVSIGYNTVLPG
jgi:hypothetical protein